MVTGRAEGGSLGGSATARASADAACCCGCCASVGSVCVSAVASGSTGSVVGGAIARNDLGLGGPAAVAAASAGVGGGGGGGVDAVADDIPEAGETPRSSSAAAPLAAPATVLGGRLPLSGGREGRS